MRNKIKILVPLVIFVLFITGCTSTDPIDDTWTTNLYPISNNTYNVGSPFYQYNSGYFANMYLNGVLLNVSSMVGPQGPTGNGTSITVNSTTTGLPGTPALVTNIGNITDAIFDFTIPQGIQGPQGINGTNGSVGPNFVDSSTGTSLVGVLFGNGVYVNASNNISASNLNLSGNITAYGITLTVPPLLAVPVWEDIRLIPGSFDRAGVTDPAYVAYSPNGGTISTYLTEWQTIDIASCTVQIPHAYKEGSDIYCHIHWTAGARGSAENGKAVGWKVDYTWTNIDDVFGNMSTLNLSDACDGVNHRHQMTPDILINGSGKTISSMLILNIKRSDTGADDTWVGTTSSNLPMMLELDLHYQIDTLGSRQVLIK
jgi:hypothetical protein